MPASAFNDVFKFHYQVRRLTCSTLILACIAGDNVPCPKGQDGKNVTGCDPRTGICPGELRQCLLLVAHSQSCSSSTTLFGMMQARSSHDLCDPRDAALRRRGPRNLRRRLPSTERFWPSFSECRREMDKGPVSVRF